jgi:hypothetical protein
VDVCDTEVELAAAEFIQGVDPVETIYHFILLAKA